jgi:hypothetical protein
VLVLTRFDPLITLTTRRYHEVLYLDEIDTNIVATLQILVHEDKCEIRMEG